MDESFSVIWVICPVRSCEAVAIVCVESAWERRQNDVMGALCRGVLEVRFLE